MTWLVGPSGSVDLAADIFDAKGDIIAAPAADAAARVAVGADGLFLKADSAQPEGLLWDVPSGGPPTGGAGGDLGATYPNPSVRAVTDATATQLAVATIVDGEALVRSGATITSATFPTAPAYGTEYTYTESLGTSSTTAESPADPFQVKLTMVFSTLGAATYQINWGYFWAVSSTSSDFFGRVRSVTHGDLVIHNEESKDAGIDQQHSASGFANVTYGGIVTDTLTIEWAGETAPGTVTKWISNARLAIFRVS